MQPLLRGRSSLLAAYPFRNDGKRDKTPCLTSSPCNTSRRASRWETRVSRPLDNQGAQELERLHPEVDDFLSRRPLNLDAAGYFIIWVDYDTAEIVAEHYTNTINKDGESV